MGSGPSIRRAEGGLLVGFRVSPSASRTSVRGLYGDRIKVSVSAPPENDRANLELIGALARWMGLERDTIHIKSGHTSRDKVLVFENVAEALLRTKLTALVQQGQKRK